MSARKIYVPEKQKERDPDLINAEVALKRAVEKARQRGGYRRCRRAGWKNR